MNIRLATLEDVPALVSHEIKHMGEPAFEGLPAHPFPLDHVWDVTRKLSEKEKSIPLAVTEVGWQRCFILLDGEKIVGHLNLKNLFLGTLHRAQLGMGLNAEYRGQGLGKKLLQEAIAWAKTEPSLHWMDLSVFAHNTPARKLYSSVGFIEQYNFEDKIRVNGLSIDDIYMTLNLKR